MKREMLIRQRGFSLIEVLVAAVIMSVGVLGVAGMQVASLQQNRTALLRSEAQQLAWDLSDRMLVNPQATYAAVDFSEAPSFTTNCSNSNCTLAQMAEYDIAQWKCAINAKDNNDTEYAACNGSNLDIAGTLPGGQGQIEIKGSTSTDGNVCDMSAAQDAGEYCIVVRWLNTDGATYSTVQLQTRVAFDAPPTAP
ncbi:MAG: type IV pilus modification protein PilV [Pseudomonadales bacterium]|nr:type IV pilus modification protein PilV [Pseudomonadales bacterium]MBO7007668.1 type IV pilus modification protein PilV [Pseudomonadales bacterium]